MLWLIAVLGLIDLILYAGAAVALIRWHRHSGDCRLLWLLLPMAALPVFGMSIACVEQVVVNGSIAGWFSSLLAGAASNSPMAVLGVVYVVEHLVWGASSLLAAMVLRGGAERTERSVPHGVEAAMLSDVPPFF